jgi:8-oxo-dGTP pyrophosphatase MutT (NUDIX family)
MRIRRSARVVLLNDRNEVFLFRHRDSRGTFWVTPGGGVEEGETWEEAAIREMWEETGISGIPLGPCIWTRTPAVNMFGEPAFGQERYYLVRCGMREVSNANQLDYEREVYTVSGWWSLEQMRSSQETFYPDLLCDLLLPVVSGDGVTQPIPLQT